MLNVLLFPITALDKGINSQSEYSHLFDLLPGRLEQMFIFAGATARTGAWETFLTRYMRACSHLFNSL